MSQSHGELMSARLPLWVHSVDRLHHRSLDELRRTVRLHQHQRRRPGNQGQRTRSGSEVKWFGREQGQRGSLVKQGQTARSCEQRQGSNFRGASKVTKQGQETERVKVRAAGSGSTGTKRQGTRFKVNTGSGNQGSVSGGQG